LKSKSDFENCENKCSDEKSKNDLWLCIECCYLSCGRQSRECAIKHKNEKDHLLVINIANFKIWCYECDEDLDVMINSVENETESIKKKTPNFTNMIKFKEKIADWTEKFLKNKKKSKGQEEKKEKEDIIEEKQEASIKKLAQNNNFFLFGLTNLGNTCYFNSIIQCLYSVTDLVEIYMNTKELDFTDENPTAETFTTSVNVQTK
jgi:ubiquitin carboxyl-terminal hydrolase 16/45